MEKVLVYYINDSLFISKVRIITEHYIEIEGVFPVQNVRSDYYNDKINFYAEDSLYFLKVVSVEILKPHHLFVKKKMSEIKGIVKNYLTPSEDAYPLEILRDIVINHYFSNPSFFSSALLQRFANDHKLNSVYRKPSFEVLWELNTVEERLENYINMISNLESNEVLFYHYKDDPYWGMACERKLTLDSGNLQCELLLQELCIMMFSRGKDNIDFKSYFTERFKSFSDQKKLMLFRMADDLGIKIYKNHLNEWWHNRY